MSLTDQIASILQHVGLEKLLAYNDIEEHELVEMLLEDGIIELPDTMEIDIDDDKEEE